MTTRVTIDGAAIRKHLNNEPQAQARLFAVAQTLKSVAETASPVGSPKNSKSPGYFKRRWYVRKFRHMYFVGNRDAFYHLVEFGSMNNRTYAPTRQAMRRIAGANDGITMTMFPKGTDNPIDG